MTWIIEPPIRPRFAGNQVFVGEWQCPGEQRPWSTEFTGDFELELPMAGMHLRTIRGRRKVVDPTLAVLHGPAEEYLMASPSGLPQRSTILRVKEDLMVELNPKLILGIIPTSPQSALLHHRLRFSEDPVALEETTLMLINQILQDEKGLKPQRLQTGPSHGTWRRLVEAIQHVISIHFAEKLTLEGIAKTCGASPFHASRVFRTITGTTIHRHLNQVRLRAALFDLEDRRGAITELALGVGFSSHSHFTSAFRREFGHSPNELKLLLGQSP